MSKQANCYHKVLTGLLTISILVRIVSLLNYIFFGNERQFGNDDDEEMGTEIVIIVFLVGLIVTVGACALAIRTGKQLEHGLTTEERVAKRCKDTFSEQAGFKPNDTGYMSGFPSGQRIVPEQTADKLHPQMGIV